jgi:hypothetical protein
MTIEDEVVGLLTKSVHRKRTAAWVRVAEGFDVAISAAGVWVERSTCDAGDEVREWGEVATIERQVSDLLSFDDRAGGRSREVYHRCRVINLDGLAGGTNGHLELDRLDLGDLKHEGLIHILKAGVAGFDLIVASGYGGKGEVAVAASCEGLGCSGVCVGELHSGVRHHGAGWIRDDPGDASGVGLRP